MVGPLWPRTIAIAVFEVAGVVRSRAGGYGNIEPVVCSAAHFAKNVVLPSTASLEISHYSCMIGWI